MRERGQGLPGQHTQWGPGEEAQLVGGVGARLACALSWGGCLWGAPLGSVGDRGARRMAVSVQAEAVWGEPYRELINPTLGEGKQQKQLQLWKPRAEGRVLQAVPSQ